MKTYFKTLLLASLVIFICLSCSKGGDDDGAPPFNSFVKYSIHGPTINGNFEIKKTQQNDGNVQIASYVPENPENGTDELVYIAMTDNDQLLSFRINVPPEEKLTELIYGHPTYSIYFGFEHAELETGTVSVHVTEMNIDSEFHNMIRYVKGNFEGVVLHIYEEDGVEIQESHTVNGNFEYVPF